MPSIRQLPPDVVSKIAAGEVIERPASVVKELLENSVDAGATRIDVDIENGGADLIRVVDDGCGIAAMDLPLAFASHATSKLINADDLFRVQTLGFRGEALASIGGVAQVRIQSRPNSAETAAANMGAEILCDGGKLEDVRSWNGSPGTRIEVRKLFFNTPVRRKFLRTTSTEMGHIAEAVTRLALTCPTANFKLTHNDRQVFEIPSSAGLRERLGLFYGAEIRDQLIALDTPPVNGVRLYGYIADPACNRGNARMQYFFINGRWIRDRSLAHALQEAYRGLIMVGRYPAAFLFIELPPDQVDVNVHPTKSEVRFRDSQAIYHLILATIRERLRQENLTATLRVTPQVIGNGLVGNSATEEESASFDFPPVASSDGEGLRALTHPGSHSSDSPSHPLTLSPSHSSKAFQLHDAYLVLETPEGMLVIDQHALHERIMYEAWKARLRAGDLEIQRLLMPEPVDLPAEQAACALDNKEMLEKIGLGVEDFGGGTILVTSYPALVKKGSPAALLKSAVEFLAGHDRPPTAEQLVDDLLKMMACKAAIKAGDHLSSEEIAALIAQRHWADNTHHCPHGRPTALLFSKQELDRQFKRT